MNWIATHKQQQEQVQSMWRAMLVYHDSHLSVFAQQQMFRSLVAMKVITQIKYPEKFTHKFETIITNLLNLVCQQLPLDLIFSIISALLEQAKDLSTTELNKPW